MVWPQWWPLQSEAQINVSNLFNRTTNIELQKLMDLLAEGSIVEHETAHIVFLLVFDQ